MWNRFTSIETDAISVMRGEKDNAEVDLESKRSATLREEREVSQDDSYKILDTSDMPPDGIREGLINAVIDAPAPDPCKRVNIVTSELDGWTVMGITNWEAQILLL